MLSDFALHPERQIALASCWNGRLYLVRYDGTVQATVEVGGPAKLRWSADGRFAIAGTQQGEIWRVDADGTRVWHVRIPERQAARWRNRSDRCSMASLFIGSVGLVPSMPMSVTCGSSRRRKAGSSWTRLGLRPSP
jgi:hypothetical protein